LFRVFSPGERRPSSACVRKSGGCKEAALRAGLGHGQVGAANHDFLALP
jgi:hypothetical protein